MAPPKAPGPSGPPLSPAPAPDAPLTPRELHELLLRILALGALTEGPTVAPGSRTERSLSSTFRKIKRVVEDAERRTPLAEIKDGSGTVITTFMPPDFDVVGLQEDLVRLARNHKRLFHTAKFRPKTFAQGIVLAFATVGRGISIESALEDVELLTSKYWDYSPTKIAGVLLGRHQTKATRSVQYLRRAAFTARRTRGHLGRGDMTSDIRSVQEFLTCLQVPPTEVLALAFQILAKRPRRRGKRGDYALRDILTLTWPGGDVP